MKIPYGLEIMRLKVARVQRRRALRVALAYLTISNDAILTIYGILTIDLLAFERWIIYNGRRKEEARELIIVKWQEQRDASVKER